MTINTECADPLPIFFWRMEGFVSEALELLELEKCAEECQNQTLISSQLLENPKVLESKGVCIQKLQVPR